MCVGVLSEARIQVLVQFYVFIFLFLVIYRSNRRPLSLSLSLFASLFYVLSPYVYLLVVVRFSTIAGWEIRSVYPGALICVYRGHEQIFTTGVTPTSVSHNTFSLVQLGRFGWLVVNSRYQAFSLLYLWLPKSKNMTLETYTTLWSAICLSPYSGKFWHKVGLTWSVHTRIYKPTKNKCPVLAIFVTLPSITLFSAMREILLNWIDTTNSCKVKKTDITR